MEELEPLLARVRACDVCAKDLPQGPRPVVQVGRGAGVVILGQAPGSRVHASGVPWDDPSGVRLRRWLGVNEATFYDPTRVAVLPMGFCFPGTGKGGDLPPRPECAPLWHEALLAHVAPSALRVVVGAYAQARYVPDRARTLTETVAGWRERLPGLVVMPHPSPRNHRWLAKNPWFEAEAVPAIQAVVAAALGSEDGKR